MPSSFPSENSSAATVFCDIPQYMGELVACMILYRMSGDIPSQCLHVRKYLPSVLELAGSYRNHRKFDKCTLTYEVGLTVTVIRKWSICEIEAEAHGVTMVN